MEAMESQDRSGNVDAVAEAAFSAGIKPRKMTKP